MTKANILKKLRLLAECLVGLAFAVAMIYLLDLAQQHDNGCRDKEVGAIGGCDGSGMCGVAYTDGTKGFQRLPVIGFGYTVCPEVKK